MDKTNIPFYKKDQSTGAVYNTNQNDLDQYYAKREKVLKEQENNDKILKLEEKVNSLDEKLDLILQKITREVN